MTSGHGSMADPTQVGPAEAGGLGPDDEPGASAPPVERLRNGGSRTPIAVAGLIVVGLAIVAWRPWGGTAPSTSTPPSPAAVDQPESTAPAAIGAYVSLTDNEWTVVALLTSDGPTSTEEPATQHPPAWWPGGPFHVLQQGLHVLDPTASEEVPPAERCQAAVPPRDRTFVLLPAGRVAYLGATFPGMDPRATVSVTSVDPPGVRLDPVSPLVVRIVGQASGDRFAIPTTGHGGAIVFATSPPAILPAGLYRIDVSAPGLGRRLLYACVGT